MAIKIPTRTDYRPLADAQHRAAKLDKELEQLREDADHQLKTRHQIDARTKRRSMDLTAELQGANADVTAFKHEAASAVREAIRGDGAYRKLLAAAVKSEAARVAEFLDLERVRIEVGLERGTPALPVYAAEQIKGLTAWVNDLLIQGYLGPSDVPAQLTGLVTIPATVPPILKDPFAARPSAQAPNQYTPAEMKGLGYIPAPMAPEKAKVPA